jgi:hypothetical protein
MARSAASGTTAGNATQQDVTHKSPTLGANVAPLACNTSALASNTLPSTNSLANGWAQVMPAAGHAEVLDDLLQYNSTLRHHSLARCSNHPEWLTPQAHWLCKL